jgi:hypothetical protein
MTELYSRKDTSATGLTNNPATIHMERHLQTVLVSIALLIEISPFSRGMVSIDYRAEKLTIQSNHIALLSMRLSANAEDAPENLT